MMRDKGLMQFRSSPPRWGLTVSHIFGWTPGASAAGDAKPSPEGAA